MRCSESSKPFFRDNDETRAQIHRYIQVYELEMLALGLIEAVNRRYNIAWGRRKAGERGGSWTGQLSGRIRTFTGSGRGRNAGDAHAIGKWVHIMFGMEGTIISGCRSMREVKTCREAGLWRGIRSSRADGLDKGGSQSSVK